MKKKGGNIEESEYLVAGFERVFRQLTKMLIGRLAFPKYLGLIRKIFIEESENYLKKQSGRNNVSLTDLGLVTGIDTRTLSKVRESEEYGKPISESESFFSDLTPESVVIDKWQSDPEFLNDEGGPAALRVWGKQKTFESLVQSSIKSRGITVKSILKRLLDSESATLSEDKETVYLHPAIWMRYQTTDVEATIKSGLAAVSQHLNTVINNIESLSSEVEPKLERIFWSDRIDPRKLDEFRKTLEALLDDACHRASNEIDTFNRDFNVKKPISGGVGFYYFDTKTSSH